MEHLDSLLDIGNGVVADNANGDLLVDGAAFDKLLHFERKK